MSMPISTPIVTYAATLAEGTRDERVECTVVNARSMWCLTGRLNSCFHCVQYVCEENWGYNALQWCQNREITYQTLSSSVLHTCSHKCMCSSWPYPVESVKLSCKQPQQGMQWWTHFAGPTILTGVGVTVIDVDITVLPLVASHTWAHVITFYVLEPMDRDRSWNTMWLCVWQRCVLCRELTVHVALFTQGFISTHSFTSSSQVEPV